MVETGNLLSTCKFFLFDIFLKLSKTIIQIIYFYNLVLFPQFFLILIAAQVVTRATPSLTPRGIFTSHL